MNDDIKILLALLGLGGLAYYLGQRKPPTGYPKTISKGTYSFTANNQSEEIQLKDFLGIDPPGVDIDTYLSGLTSTQLDQWKSYWISMWTSLNRGDLITFTNTKYNQYYTSDYPKTISRGAYSFTAFNATEETFLLDFLGIDPPGPAIDTYLSGLTESQLDNWYYYWMGIWSSLNRDDLGTFTYNKYSLYKLGF